MTNTINEVTIYSKTDVSVNHIKQLDLLGKEKIETRIVQRYEDTLVLYISTHTGCREACRFCWLTQSGQTIQNEISREDYRYQIEWIISQLKDDPRIDKIKVIHINLMARGDSLSSPYFLFSFKNLRAYIKVKLSEFFPNPIQIKYKISSIFPKDLIFNTEQKGMENWIEYEANTGIYGEIEFYYSLYTLNHEFRNRWIPKGLDPDYVGRLFKGHRPLGNMSQFRLHHALIEGVNTSDNDVYSIHSWLEKHDIKCFLNLVKYNPYNESSGKPASEETTKRYIDLMLKSDRILDVYQVIPAATDNKCGCGMFVEGNLIKT
jgi:adenine C2-methylase RlmN of 23S rRNA A2503 and tRNA A37